MSLPVINWIKKEKDKHNFHTDGNRYLIALQVRSMSQPLNDVYWDYFIICVTCDGEGAELSYENGDIFDAWSWDDVEYFAVLDGEMPTNEIVDSYD